MSVLYCSLVRSPLFYASQVWSPYYANISSRIESVQHRFFRLLSFKICKGMGFSDHDYSDISLSTGVCSLRSFRDSLDVLFLYKLLHDFVDIEYLFSSVRYNEHLRVLRQFRPFLLENRGGNFLNKSFIFRATSLVNASPLVISIFDEKIGKFKCELRKVVLKYE